MGKPYNISADEKATAVMVYTKTEMIWGDVITPHAIRVGIWLKTDTAPAYLNLYNAHILSLSPDGNNRPTAYSHTAIPISMVMGFHTMPNVQEPLFYDANEPFRKMEPVNALLGLLHGKGALRMASQSTLRQFLDVNRDVFLSLFDVEISHPRMPQNRTFRLAHALIRTSETVFASRD
ncbi:MAG: hypothetical protein KA314_25475 [Chloroflexi bacterium]|nr:hypothetical protein [Chloroflexota bacterium]MBP8059200.1 hypothetical protein [Chloroflexota bacterium]